MNNIQVVRQSADDSAVDSGMPWRVYVVEDFAFAENDDADEATESADLDVFVDMPGTDAEAVRASELPHVEGALGAAHRAPAANDQG